MISFFRHIRQKLLTESKFSKYLIYALGEIILVVIGILIALQINNWNEKKKEKDLAYRYYKNMILSFEKDLVKIDNYLVYIDKSIKNIDRFETLVKESSNFKVASQYLDSVNYLTSDVDINSSIWETLVNSGDVTLLDEDIRNELLDFWNSYDDFYESDFANKEHYYNVIEDISLREGATTYYIRGILNKEHHLMKEVEKSRNYTKEVRSIFALLFWRKWGNAAAKQKLTQFKDEIENLILMMQKEIASG